MRSGLFIRGFAIVLAALALGAAPAAAAEPTVFELPAATHAGEGIAAGPDGSIWFDPTHGEGWEGTEAGLGHLGADGTFTELPVEGFGEPVIGPDGEVWVTLQIKDAQGRYVRQIASLSSDGQLGTRFKVGRGGSLIGPVAVSRRAVWFVRSHGHMPAAIERLDRADGSVRRVRVLAPNCESTGIAVSANETLWFTEACRHQGPYGYEVGRASVARLRPDGKLKRWKLAGGGFPMPVLLGPGGAAWVGASGKKGVGVVAHISRDGTLDEYPVRYGDTSSLALGADGHVWFRSTFGGDAFRALDSVGPDGKVGKPICADPTCQLEPTAVTAAPDGTLWYDLTRPVSTGGGGLTHIMEGQAIATEPGHIGRLDP
jgi:streptogramin lyase